MPAWSRALELAQCEKGVHYHYSKKPFDCLIPGGLVDGRKIYIHAICPPDSQRFSINLQDGDDIAFHLNPRVDEGDVVMNSRTSDEWGSEERTGRLPIRPRLSFLICITCLQQGYEIEIDNEWVALFNHRMPHDKVRTINVEGDVDIIGIHILNSELHKENLISIPGGVETSQAIMVNGKCDSDCSGFSLNLQCGDSDEDDIALHFNPREGDKEVIRNSYIAGSWGDEERGGDFPFGPGEQFAVTIVVLAEGFQVKVNGNPFTKYNHRLPISRICKLSIQGDAKLRNVSFELPPAIKFPQDYIKAELIDPETPAKTSIPDFKPGCVLNVLGVVHKDPTRFKINLQSGPGEEDDIMLHINPRWDQGDPKIVFNSREGGNWADEELWSEEFPFKESCGFEITVQCEDEGFRIMADGFEQMFKHRIDCTKVNHAFVNGSIDVKRVIVS